MKKYYASGGKDYNIWSYPPNKQYINIGQCDGEVPDMDMLRNPTVQKLKLISQADIDSGVAQRNVYGRLPVASYHSFRHCMVFAIFFGFRGARGKI